jgi:hypothetical protein
MTQQVPEGFQHRLLGQLLGRIPDEIEQPVRAPRQVRPADWRRRLVLAAAGLTAVLLVTAVVVGSGASRHAPMASPAWAVETNPDGSVTVKVFNDITDPTDLQSDLRAAGVPAVVWVDREVACDLPFPQTTRAVQMANSDRGPAFRIFPKAIPTGKTLFILIQRETQPVGKVVKVGVSWAVLVDPPSCRPLPSRTQ